MPRISQFYGIVIAMYFNDHAPPHFHAKYAQHEASFVIETFKILEGSIPGRAKRLVVEWAREHQEELSTNWERARNREALHSISPLD